MLRAWVSWISTESLSKGRTPNICPLNHVIIQFNSTWIYWAFPFPYILAVFQSVYPFLTVQFIYLFIYVFIYLFIYYVLVFHAWMWVPWGQLVLIWFVHWWIPSSKNSASHMAGAQEMLGEWMNLICAINRKPLLAWGQINKRQLQCEVVNAVVRINIQGYRSARGRVAVWGLEK